MNNGFVNSDFIIDKLYRDYRFSEKHVHETDVHEWITECLRLISVDEMYLDKVADCSGDNDPCIEIVNKRGTLPCDFVSLIEVREKDATQPLTTGTDTFFKQKSGVGLGKTSYSTNKKYQLQGGYIFTDFDEGYLEMVYKAMPLDSEDKPLIIDDQLVINTVASFVAYRLAFSLSFSNEINGQLVGKLEQIYVGNKRKVEAYLNTPSFGEAMSIVKSMNGLTTRTYLNKYTHKDLGEMSR